MIVFSIDECLNWFKGRTFALDELSQPVRCNNSGHKLHGKFPANFNGILWIIRQIEQALIIDSQCLVWISDWSIFHSGDNFHLFYKFSQSYNCNALISSSPGHLCMSYERAEIVTLVWLCVSQGWDVHVVPDNDCISAFFSHDGWFELGYSNRDLCIEAREKFKEINIALELQ